MLTRYLIILFLTVTTLFSITEKAYSRHPWDARVLHSMNSCSGKGLTNFNKFVSNSELVFLVGVPVGIGLYGALSGDDAEIDKAVSIGATVVSSYVVSTLMKVIIQRKRPYDKYPDYIVARAHESSYSFPSGHTMGAFGLATSLTLNYRKWYITAPAYLWATAVGYSRMQLGVHYPTDVFAGAILGSACAWGSYELTKLWVKERKKRDFNYCLKNNQLY